MGKVIKYILEEIIDPLAVKYLLSRRSSEPWNKDYGEGGVIKKLEHYRTPRQHRNGHQILIRGEELFRELHEEIRAKYSEEGVAVIDTITKEWRYAPCIADAEKAAAEMKNHRAIYFRPCNT